MQLNNTKNGRIIIIDHIKPSQNRVNYSVYELILRDENGLIVKEVRLETKAHTFALPLYSLYSQKLDISLEDYCYQKLAEELPNQGILDYVVSNEVQNWMFADRPYRVAINKAISQTTAIKDANYKMLSDILIERHADFIEQKEDSDIYLVMYVNTLDPNELSVVSDYLGVWMFTEKKIIIDSKHPDITIEYKQS